LNEKKRILVIDDDADLRESITILLNRAGFVVDAVENGEEAIEKSKLNSYNVALIDIVLPDINGIDLLKKLKEINHSIRNIIITGFASLGNAVKALNLGADSYLIKPIASETLLDSIQKQLKDQEDEATMTQEKVVKFIETRVRSLED
jgi:DNA-binding NtrC family response regulator